VILTYTEEKSGPKLTSNVFPFDGSYVGRLIVDHTGKPSEILTKLNNLAGYDLDEEIEIYEVGLCYLIYICSEFIFLLLSLCPLSLLVISDK
jgi:hypothetical protein